MKTRVFTISVALIALVFIFTAACGKGKNPTATQNLTGQGQTQLQVAAETPIDPLTEEDYMVLEMSPEERWDYLFEKYKDLVIQYHGVVLDYVPYPGKSASGTGDSTHKVQEAVDWQDPPKKNQVYEEDLEITGNSDWTWDLSFLERLSGDLNFYGRVTIADLTPIAERFGRPRTDRLSPDQFEDKDWHLDRLTDGNGTIQIADITLLAKNFGAYYNFRSEPPGWTPADTSAPDIDRLSGVNLHIGTEDTTAIAVDFGMQVTGYSVCSFPKSGTPEDSQLIAQRRREVGCRNSEDSGYSTR